MFIDVFEDFTIRTFLLIQTWAVVRIGLGVEEHLVARGMGFISCLMFCMALLKDAVFVELFPRLFCVVFIAQFCSK